jgi:TPR repeat protein
LCYFEGKFPYLDFGEAFHLFEQVAYPNYDHAQYQLCIFYSHGIFVQKDLKMSINYLKESVKQQHQGSLVPYGLFILHQQFNGHQVQDNAVDYFRIASNNRRTEGMFWYGFCLIEGNGVRQNFFEGSNLLQDIFSQDILLSKIYFLPHEPLKRKYS